MRRSPSHATPARRLAGGFTLVEVIAALSLTGLVLLGAWRLLAQLADGRDRMDHAYSTAARRANGLRVLRALVERAETSLESTRQFVGDKESARFETWCDAPGGWLERCRVSVTLTQGGDTTVVSVQQENGGSLQLLRASRGASFLYLERWNGQAVWQPKWSGSITLPLAMGIATETDTLALPVGVHL